MQRLLSVFLLIASLALQSCIQGEEEIWIEDDGSGRVEASYSLPSLALRFLGNPEDYLKALKLVDEREDGIEIQVATFEIIGGKANFKLVASFNDVRDLLEIAERNEAVFVQEANADPSQLDAVAGEIEYGLSGLGIFFNRSIPLGSMFPDEVKKRPAALGKSAFRYTLHLPVEVTESNADEISADKKTVTWNFLLKENIDKPMLMSVKTKLPIPWWGWLLLILALVLLIFLIEKIFRFVRRTGRADKRAIASS